MLNASIDKEYSPCCKIVLFGWFREYPGAHIRLSFHKYIRECVDEPGFRELIKRIVERHNKDAEENHTEKIENFCPHMVRHTYTSLAYSAGADVKIVSQNLGHASTSVTLDTYMHLTEDKKKEQEVVAQTVRIS